MTWHWRPPVPGGRSSADRELLLRWCTARRGEAPGPRALLVAAHPDDEVIGSGARLAHVHSVDLVHVTDGVPRNPRRTAAALQPSRALWEVARAAYKAARRRELEAAMLLGGLKPHRLHSIDIPDQEAAHTLAGLTAELVRLLRAHGPDVVVTQPYEGGHPDHDATAFAVHHACELLSAEGLTPPAVIEMTAYHLAGDAFHSGEFLPGGDPGRAVPLTVEDAALKRRMLDCFATQRAILARLAWGPERFRLAPAYDFTAPPPSGDVYYERLGLAMTVRQWQQLAHEGRRALGFEEESRRTTRDAATSGATDYSR
jgi:N-acetylglucosamine malate deacetylase 2